MDAPAPPPIEDAAFRDWFIERFAAYWHSQALSRVEGRIVGHLLLDDSPGVSAADLAAAVGASRGSVSTYTRRLVDIGFVHRVRLPGDRSHYFVMAADVWGGFLDNEHAYLEHQRVLADTALTHMRPGGRAYERVRNMHDYMVWLLGFYGTLRAQWEGYKSARPPFAERPAPPAAGPGATGDVSPQA